MEEKYTITNHIEELSGLAEKVETLAGQWKLPSDLIMKINLALEEVISNIIFYAFNDPKDHEITIKINLKNNVLSIVVEDDGIPFDPTAVANPDINQNAKDRPVGGLGIFLIRNLMDKIFYSRTEKKNILTITKRIEP